MSNQNKQYKRLYPSLLPSELQNDSYLSMAFMGFDMHEENIFQFCFLDLFWLSFGLQVVCNIVRGLVPVIITVSRVELNTKVFHLLPFA